jgi:hypothetical protein
VNDNVIRVPRWLIRKAWDKAGDRLAPRVHLIAEAGKATSGFGRVKTNVSEKIDGNVPSFHVNNSHTIVLADSRLLFDNWEYRFWCVDLINFQPQGTECRNCNITFGTMATRRKHNKDKDCFNTLVKAYLLLLRDKRCVVCDNITTHDAWGVPLCKGTICAHNWMHLNAQPTALTNALAVVAKTSMESFT